MKSIIAIWFISFSFFVYGSSFSDLDRVMENIMENDPRNTGVDIQLSKADGNLMFCVNDLGELSSQMDVFRIFLQTAAALENHPFQNVGLCDQERIKFILSGEDFLAIGKEFGSQNVMYTLRTFPEKLSLPDGSRAFVAHRGGVIYVMNKQMSDFDKMNRDWYLNEILTKRQADKAAKRPKTFAKDDDVF